MTLAAPKVLPAYMANTFATAIWSFAITAAAMLAVTAWRGQEPDRGALSLARSGWLQQTQIASSRLPVVDESDSALPVMLGIAVVLVGATLSFVVFW